jgi:undecaprenyl-diphosphatase
MRLRPLQDPQLHFVVPSAFDRDLFPPAWSGFPSDHAVIMFAFVTAVWLWSWRLGVIALAWVIVVVLFPRLYIGFHYPTDILVGAVIGVMMTLAAHRIPLPRAWIDLPGRWAQTQPQWFYAAAFLITYQLGTNFDDIRHIGNGVLALLCHLV